MNKNWLTLSIIVLVLIVGVGWAAGFFDSDPQVAELQQFRDEALKRADDMPEEERRAQFEGFRKKVRELSDEQRHKFFESSRSQFQQFAMKRMNNFFAKSPEEQQQSLDQMIDRMEEWRQQRADNGNGDRGDRGNRGNMSPQQQDQRRKQGLDRTTPEMRANMDRFRDMLNDRRQERGLDPIQGGRGRFHGHGHWR
jgi:hypothetical protein